MTQETVTTDSGKKFRLVEFQAVINIGFHMHEEEYETMYALVPVESDAI